MERSETPLNSGESDMSNIPLLSDYADENLTPSDRSLTEKPKPIDPITSNDNRVSGGQKQEQTSQQPFKENPFLPYEHLAKLAMEREQFKQDLEAFTTNMKQEGSYSSQYPSQDQTMVQAITHKIIEQIKPIIEQQVRDEVAQYSQKSDQT